MHLRVHPLLFYISLIARVTLVQTDKIDITIAIYGIAREFSVPDVEWEEGVVSDHLGTESLWRKSL